MQEKNNSQFQLESKIELLAEQLKHERKKRRNADSVQVYFSRQKWQNSRLENPENLQIL